MNYGNIAVRVYDSAAAPHFEDTRFDGETGVGSGFINFEVDGEGRPTGFQFSSQDVSRSAPIAVVGLNY